MRCGAFRQSVDITVADDGAPSRVRNDCWSKENAAREYREQSFGGVLSRFRSFDGYRWPTRVEGDNHFGPPGYYAFFKARVTGIRFLQGS